MVAPCTLTSVKSSWILFLLTEQHLTPPLLLITDAVTRGGQTKFIAMIITSFRVKDLLCVRFVVYCLPYLELDTPQT